MHLPPRLSNTPTYTSHVDLHGPDSAGLTPRTPFSRQTANAEEGRSRGVVPVNGPIAEDEDDGNLDEIDLLQTQSHPLLGGSDSTSSKGPGWSEKKRKPSWEWIRDRLRTRLAVHTNERLPLGLIVGAVAAFLLLLMIVLSIRRPETLLSYLRVNSTAIAFEALDEESQARFNQSTVIDYAEAGYNTYPLTTNEYIKECWKVTNDPRMKISAPYWGTRPGAEFDVLHKKPTSTHKTCTSSITYLLHGSVGLMADLAHLAQVAGFAREQNRTLFVYDADWNRGRWTDHFLPFSETIPGPEPGCAPPPSEGMSHFLTSMIFFYRAYASSEIELVACPRTARHWVTSAHIDYFHMGEQFEQTFEDPYKQSIERKKPIFDRAAESFAEAIWPNAVNQKLIQRARHEFGAMVDGLQDENDGEYIATHIRRGDRKAMSWRYQDMPEGQIPTSEYVEAVWTTDEHLHNLHNSGFPLTPPLVYLATDSPSIVSEFTELLLSNVSLVQAINPDRLTPSVYGLRTSSDPELRSLAPEQEYVQAQWDERPQEDRIRETRGVIVDFALLSGAWPPKKDADAVFIKATGGLRLRPAATICALPSNMCKLAAVALGWGRAFDMGEIDMGPNRRWVEIDNRGSIIPMWNAFEIF